MKLKKKIFKITKPFLNRRPNRVPQMKPKKETIKAISS
jgi:hypothetical protein